MGNGQLVALGALAAGGLVAAIMAVAPPRGAPPAPARAAAADAVLAPRPPEAQAADAEPAEAERRAGPEPDPAPPAPAFDVVRVEPDGTGVVAGRAEPGATVAVLSEGEVATEAVADADGRFVAFLDLTPSPDPRSLTLREGPDGAASAETVILGPVAGPAAVSADGPATSPALAPLTEAPPALAAPLSPDGPGEGPQAADALADALADAGASAGVPGLPPSAAPDPSPAGGAASAAGSEMPDVRGAEETQAFAGADAAPAGPAVAPTADAAPPQAAVPEVLAAAGPVPEPGVGDTEDPPPAVAGAPARPPVLVSDAGGVRVVQPALPPGPEAAPASTVALDAIAYDGVGEVTLSGRAAGDGAVRLYLDNVAVGEAAVGPDGAWRAPLEDAGPGVYTLRVDEVDRQGRVVSRIETPFLREEREDVAAALGPGAGGRRVAVRTVQPGNTLWAIARDRYDEPLMYVQVFEANRDRIRDPDLIYPGQVFVLPDL